MELAKAPQAPCAVGAEDERPAKLMKLDEIGNAVQRHAMQLCALLG